VFHLLSNGLNFKIEPPELYFGEMFNIVQCVVKCPDFDLEILLVFRSVGHIEYKGFKHIYEVCLVEMEFVF